MCTSWKAPLKLHTFWSGRGKVVVMRQQVSYRGGEVVALSGSQAAPMLAHVVPMFLSVVRGDMTGRARQ